MTDSDWERVGREAITAIRRDWPVSKLEAMAEEGLPTEVSGDALHA